MKRDWLGEVEESENGSAVVTCRVPLPACLVDCLLPCS